MTGNGSAPLRISFWSVRNLNRGWSSAFLESFRSLNTKLKSVKHTIYVQLSYYKYCFFKCFFIIFLIVSTTTLWRWLLRKLWSVSWGAASAEMPRAPKRSRELRVVFAVGACGRFGEVKFQPRNIFVWLEKSEKFWMNFLMLQEVLC